jgi:phosphoesterase RecJ-like protein
MFDRILEFFNRHQSFILTTHDHPDADGLGSELVLNSILRKKGKEVRIINSSTVPVNLQFIIPPDQSGAEFEKWKPEEHFSLLENSAMLILDTSDEFHLGSIREALKKVNEVFIIDHHEAKSSSKLTGFVDVTASSTSELSVELACFMDIDLDPYAAIAAYTGIVFDSGFFAYPRTSIRTFKAASKTLEWGAAPNKIYKQLMENSSYAALLIQKQALSKLQFFADKKIALMVLSNEDFEIAGAEFEEVENTVNIPLKAREVEVSLLLKEKSNGEVFCSLRSKGTVNVSKVAQEFGGGGHVTAAGFRSLESMGAVVNKLLICIESRLAADNSGAASRQ